MNMAARVAEAPQSAPAAPTKIWVNASGKEQPEWVVERMADGKIATNGAFLIESGEGPVTVEPGFVVFEYQGEVYSCRSTNMLARVAELHAKAPDAAAPVPPQPRPHLSDPIAREVAPKSKSKKRDPNAPLRLKPLTGEPCAPQFAALARLKVDDSYQRSIEGGSSRTLIRKIAENWDWRLCLPLLVSRRDGELYVIDGQHRLEAAQLRGDIPHLPVVVFDFDDPKAEAELFVQANRSRRAMSKLDDFHAALVAGDAKASAVNEVVAAAGLTVARIQAWQYWKPGEVVFVTSIQRALHVHGKAAVQQALNIIGRAFEGEVLTGAGAIFEGLVTMVKEGEKASAPLDAERMERVLRECGIPGWKEAVEGIDGGAERAEAMLAALRAGYDEAGE